VCIFGAGYEGELWIDDSDHTDRNDFDAVSLDELVSGFVHFLLIKWNIQLKLIAIESVTIITVLFSSGKHYKRAYNEAG